VPKKSSSSEIHCRAFAALIGFNVVRNALLLIKRGHTGAFDCANVNEAVRSAAIGRNEAIAFIGIEEFYCAYGHGGVSFRETGVAPAKAQTRSQGREMEALVTPWRPKFPSQSTIAEAANDRIWENCKLADLIAVPKHCRVAQWLTQ
jgi:hypothetical protein